jgi:prepilin-type N-terminal cleavage/methylation domain-containing protein
MNTIQTRLAAPKRSEGGKAECGMRNQNPASSAAHSLRTPHSALRTSPGFTLIELLVVISIIGVLAGFTIPVLSAVKSAQYKKVARAELENLQTALENYKAKYGSYPPGNQFAATATYAPALFSQLYYELSGTYTNNAGNFVTLDGSSKTLIASVPLAYGVGGFINSGSTNKNNNGDDDVRVAKNFLPGLKPNQLNQYVTNNNVQTTMLVTSVGGPDDTYKPLGAPALNPFRYVYPGVNNPNSYDLWVQLVIKGKTNLVCNWSRQVIINSALP